MEFETPADYAEFLDALFNTYRLENNDGSIDDLRNRKLARYLADKALLWLEPFNAAAVLSASVGVVSDVRVEEILKLEGDALRARLIALAATGDLPLAGKPGTKGGEALEVMLSDSNGIGQKLYRDAAEHLRAAAHDMDVKLFIYIPKEG